MTTRPTVVVTGAGSGIGAAIAQTFAQNDYRVLLIGRTPQKLEKTIASLEGQSHLFFTCDISNEDEVDRLTAKLVGSEILELGLNVLVNNAGIYKNKSVLESSLKDYQTMFDTNFFGAFLLTQKLYPALKLAAPNASVINVSSTLGIKPVANTSAYSASKAAMNNWTKTLAAEWAGDSIRVNGICPGIVDTPIHDFHDQSNESEVKKQIHHLQPLKRMGLPEDIAQTVYFHATEASSWTTGSIVTVDGGLSLN